MKNTCLACGSEKTSLWARSSDVEYHSTETIFNYHLCGSCDSLFIENPPIENLSSIYPKNYYSYSKNGQNLAERVKQYFDKRQFKKLMGDLKGEHLSALDVGGGSGWLLNIARSVEPRLTETVVCDLDPGAEQRARNNGHKFHLGPIEHFDEDCRFDVIFLLNIIEHVKDPTELLKKMRKLLKPGGVVFVKTPNHDSWDARLFRHANWGGYHCPRHWVLFTPESFTHMAQKAGLMIQDLTLTQGAPFWTVSILAQFHRRGWITISAERPMAAHPLFGPLNAFFALIDFGRRPFARTSQMFATLRAG